MTRLKIRLHGADFKDLELKAGEEYTAGRQEGCDIVLGDYPGISRQHLRISHNGDNWTAQVISKFGDILVNGQKANDFILQNGTAFELGPYVFVFIEQAAEQAAPAAAAVPSKASMSANLPAVSGGYVPASRQQTEPDEIDFDEPTFADMPPSKPYLRVTNGADGQEKVFRLEGTLWLAGRDESCEIPLPDPKASRKQFQIESASTGYTITDLGSSNGTALNGARLQPQVQTPLKSGDAITVNNLIIHFEIRDPSFKEKLSNIPSEVLNLPAISDAAPDYMNQLPQLHGSGGVIRLEDYQAAMGLPQYPGYPPPKSSRKKKRPNKTVRLILVGLVAVLLLAVLFKDNKPTAPPTAADPKLVSFNKLSPDQQRFIKEIYAIAQNLVIQQKYELAYAQVEKIHELLPDGYEESKDIQQVYQDYINQKQQREYIDRKIKEERETRATVEKIINECEPKSKTMTSVDQLKQCLADAMNYDPQNPQILNMIQRVEAQAEKAKLDQSRQADYQESIRRGFAMYTKAEKLKKDGKLLEAMKAYQAFIGSGHPDPAANKEKAKKEVTELKSTIEQESSRVLSSAKQLYDSGNFKEALAEIKKGLDIDPERPETAQLRDKIERDLNAQLKAVYADSVLEESLGNIDAAKDKWRKIIELDRPDGEYQQRAKRKLRQYGNL